MFSPEGSVADGIVITSGAIADTRPDIRDAAGAVVLDPPDCRHPIADVMAAAAGRGAVCRHHHQTR
jgi:hypothetical protein